MTNARVYTALITPGADGTVTVDVAASVAEDAAGNGNTAARQASSTYTGSANTPATGAPTITGTAQIGQTLTASKGTINDADGLSKADSAETGFGYSYQWIRTVSGSDSNISGATAGTYVLQPADWGHTVKVRVSFNDDGGHSETRTSAETATVGASGLEGIDVSPGALDLTEQGAAGELRLRLETAPSRSVTVTVTGQSGTALRVSPASVTFTTQNWSTERTISISAVHDTNGANEQVTLTLTPTGAPEYAALGATPVEVTVVDDDVPGFRLSTDSLTVPEGRSRSYTVRLTTQPDADITVRPVQPRSHHRPGQRQHHRLFRQRAVGAGVHFLELEPPADGDRARAP